MPKMKRDADGNLVEFVDDSHENPQTPKTSQSSSDEPTTVAELGELYAQKLQAEKEKNLQAEAQTVAPLKQRQHELTAQQSNEAGKLHQQQSNELSKLKNRHAKERRSLKDRHQNELREVQETHRSVRETMRGEHRLTAVEIDKELRAAELAREEADGRFKEKLDKWYEEQLPAIKKLEAQNLAVAEAQTEANRQAQPKGEGTQGNAPETRP